MQTQTVIEDSMVTAINCITGKTEEIRLQNGVAESSIETTDKDSNILTAPGLIDLQINGINGIDFNTPDLTVKDVVDATYYLLSQGVTTYFPTLITNSDENILRIVDTIQKACSFGSIVNECVGGIHLEGPFMSPAEGAKGAHNNLYMKAPDWHLFSRFQEAAGNRIRIITIAPEWEGSESFIKKCRANGVLVSIGHSMANSEQVKAAVRAGATLSTHLGNGVPLLLPRHPNIIWDQLAEEDLYACIIADGIHIPDSFIKVVMKVKSKATILVSDATCFAGMPAGDYQRHVGGAVTVDEFKRVSVKGSPGLLAGAGKSLLENIETMIDHRISSIGDAWQMASSNVEDMFAKNGVTLTRTQNDRVVFKLAGSKINVMTVIKNGKVVW